MSKSRELKWQSFGPIKKLHPYHIWKLIPDRKEFKLQESLVPETINRLFNGNFEFRKTKLAPSFDKNTIDTFYELLPSTIDINDPTYESQIKKLAAQGLDNDPEEVKKFILYYRELTSAKGPTEEIKFSDYNTVSPVIPILYCPLYEKMTSPSKCKHFEPDFSHEYEEKYAGSKVGVAQTIGDKSSQEDFVAGINKEGRYDLLDNQTWDDFKRLSDKDKSNVLNYALLEMHLYGEREIGTTANATFNWTTEDKKDQKTLHILNGNLGDSETFVAILGKNGQIKIARINNLHDYKNYPHKEIVGIDLTDAIGSYDQKTYSDNNPIGYIPEMLSTSVLLEEGDQWFIISNTDGVMAQKDYNPTTNAALQHQIMTEADIAETIMACPSSPQQIAKSLVELATIRGSGFHHRRDNTTSTVRAGEGLDAVFDGHGGKIVAEHSAINFIAAVKRNIAQAKVRNLKSPNVKRLINFGQKYFVNGHNLYSLQDKILICARFFDENGNVLDKYKATWDAWKGFDDLMVRSEQWSFLILIKDICLGLVQQNNDHNLKLFVLLAGKSTKYASNLEIEQTSMFQEMFPLLNALLTLDQSSQEQIRSSIVYLIEKIDALKPDEQLKVKANQLHEVIKEQIKVSQALQGLHRSFSEKDSDSKEASDPKEGGLFYKTMAPSFYKYALRLNHDFLEKKDLIPGDLDLLSITIEHSIKVLKDPNNEENIKELEADSTRISSLIPDKIGQGGSSNNSNGAPADGSVMKKLLGLTMIVLGAAFLIGGGVGFFFSGGLSLVIGSKLGGYLISTGVALMGGVSLWAGARIYNNKKICMFHPPSSLPKAVDDKPVTHGINKLVAGARKIT